MYATAMLSTDRLTLAPLAAVDAAEVFAVRGDPQVMEFWDWPHDADPAETALLVDRLLASEDAVHWTVRLRSNQDFVGLIDLSDIRAQEAADLGFLFARPFWGLGLASEAALCVLDHARDLSLKSVRARIHTTNLRSERLLERVGFPMVESLPHFEIRPGVCRDCKRFEKRIE